MFVNRNAEMVAVQINKKCVNTNKGRVYVMVYPSKKRQVYKEYKDDIQCDDKVSRRDRKSVYSPYKGIR